MLILLLGVALCLSNSFALIISHNPSVIKHKYINIGTKLSAVTSSVTLESKRTVSTLSPFHPVHATSVLFTTLLSSVLNPITQNTKQLNKKKPDERLFAQFRRNKKLEELRATKSPSRENYSMRILNSDLSLKMKKESDEIRVRAIREKQEAESKSKAIEILLREKEAEAARVAMTNKRLLEESKAREEAKLKLEAEESRRALKEKQNNDMRARALEIQMQFGHEPQFHELAENAMSGLESSETYDRAYGTDDNNEHSDKNNRNFFSSLPRFGFLDNFFS